MHWSVADRLARARGVRPRPQGMSAMPISSEQRMCVEGIALSIFTDMTNAGATLQETLAAIYLSGLDHAQSVIEEPRRAKR